MGIVTNNVYIADADDFVALGYTKWQWQRSETIQAGPYEDLTAAVAAEAEIVGSNTNSFVVNGLTLKIEVKGTLYTVTYSGSDPISIADVVSQTDAVISAVADASDDNGALKITSTDTGTDATIEVMDGTGNTALGFTEGDIEHGLDAYPNLTAGTYNYTYIDQSGVTGYWYRYCFYNPTTGGTTQWSLGYQSSDDEVLDAADLCLCYVDLANPDGTAMSDMNIVISNIRSVDNFKLSGSNYAVMGNAITFTTDSNGHGETNLVRNLEVDIVIEGTGYVRRITIPDASTANLLDSALGSGDMFEIQQFDIPSAIRRT
jgi:hypothetical protein